MKLKISCPCILIYTLNVREKVGSIKDETLNTGGGNEIKWKSDLTTRFGIYSRSPQAGIRDKPGCEKSFGIYIPTYFSHIRKR